MIIVNIMGGLGNQMFQYAVGRRLAMINGAELKVDTSDFSGRTPNRTHTLQLTRFDIAAAPASEADVAPFGKRRRARDRHVLRLRSLLGRRAQAPAGKTYYEETGGSGFKPEILGLRNDVYLFGYFNSYKYFHEIRDVLATELVPKESPGPRAATVLSSIGGTNSVGIHFRRGDYVTDPDIRAGIDGIITDAYYRNAVAHIARSVADPHFFVFSNDMDWVRKNFEIPFPTTYVDFNPPERGYEDLWLMSRCKHNITAGGSTFSWWAAFLNPNARKTVVRTKDVNNDPRFNHPDDYFPPDWRIVPS